jgi:GxxExxY protein
MDCGETLIERQLTESVIGGFLDSYYKLGYGFSESIYTSALTKELQRRGNEVRRESAVEVLYDGERIGWYRLDMIVDRRLVVEIKATEQLPPYARRQLLNYLRCTRLEVGLVLHYGPRPKFYQQVCTQLPQLPNLAAEPNRISADS